MHSFFKLLSVALFFVSLSSFAQAPPGINYQAVARDKEGKALASRDVSVRVSILQDSENGETEYAERHLVKTNPFGLFMLVIGHGETIQGNFNFISWAVGNKWLKIELDPDGGNFFQLMGSQQLMSVPYAFYAKYAGNGYVAGPGISINNATITNTGDADSDPSNELISQISFDADKKLRITEAGTTREADLSSLIGASQNLEQVLAQGNDAGGKKITNAGTPAQPNDLATKAYVDSHADNDSDKQNEIQDLQLSTHALTITNKTNATLIDLSPYLDNTDSQSLSLDGSTLTISGGNSVNLAAVNTDAQLISLTGNNLSISGGNSIDISTINTDQQDLSRSGNTLSLSGDGTTVDLSPFLDNTDNQDLTLSGNTLSLSNDATTVSLAPYLDNTDAQTLSTQSVDTNTRSIAITGGNTLNVDVRDADASSTNEIQDLARSGNTLSLSGDGTTVDLSPYLDNTDNQDLTLSGNTLSLSNDATTVSLAPYLDNTDAQTLSTQSVDANTRSIAITGGNTLNVDVRDADASTTNEIQDLSLSGNTLSLSSDGTTVDLTSFKDNTDAQTLSFNSTTKELSVSSGNTVTLSETQTLNHVLIQGNSAGSQQIKSVAAPTASGDATNKEYVDVSIATAIATNYAFKASYSFINPGSIYSDSPLTINDDFDDFNVVASNKFTAPANGVYNFSITGNSLLGGIPLRLKVTSGTVSYFDIKRQASYPVASTINYVDTIIYKLNSGDTVELVVTSALLGERVEGHFFGYKL